MKDTANNQTSLVSERPNDKDENRLPQPISPSSIRLLSISEAAKLMQLGRDSVRTLINQGKLGFILIGKRIKIPLLEIEKMLLNETQRQLIPLFEPEASDYDLKRFISRKKPYKAPRRGAEIFDEIMETCNDGNCN